MDNGSTIGLTFYQLCINQFPHVGKLEVFDFYSTKNNNFVFYFAIVIFKVISPFDKSSVTSLSGIFIFPSLVYAHEFDP